MGQRTPSGSGVLARGLGSGAAVIAFPAPAVASRKVHSCLAAVLRYSGDMQRLLAPLYRIQRLVWRVVRPRTRGVKVMVFNDAGELLLVRHSYGNTALLMLPGGGVRPFEAPAAAAVREIREELGCALEDVAFVSLHFATQEGKRDTVHLYRARLSGEVRIDGLEIAETSFVALDALPPNVSPATRRRIAELRGELIADGGW